MTQNLIIQFQTARGAQDRAGDQQSPYWCAQGDVPATSECF